MGKMSSKESARQKRVRRIRKKIAGTPQRPRLSVFKSAKHIYCQIIDDVAGNTLAALSTVDKPMVALDVKGKTEKARQVGLMIAEIAKSRGVEKVVFDRGGYIYHGRIKALSEGAREGGLDF
jgi:large subunit ribosomal protein L18